MIIDSNIVIHAITPGDFTTKAREILSQGSLHAPEILIAEVANVLGRMVRTRTIEISQAAELYNYAKKLPLRLSASRELIDRAFELSLDLVHPIFDCYYLELALREKLPFVTTDNHFIQKVRARAYDANIIHLTDWNS